MDRHRAAGRSSPTGMSADGGPAYASTRTVADAHHEIRLGAGWEITGCHDPGPHVTRSLMGTRSRRTDSDLGKLVAAKFARLPLTILAARRWWSPVRLPPAHRPAGPPRRGRRAARPALAGRRWAATHAQTATGGSTRRVQRAKTMGDLLKSVITGVLIAVDRSRWSLAELGVEHRARSSPAPASSASRSASAPRRWSRTSSRASS